MKNGVQILVVDDNESLADNIVKILAEAGFTSKDVATGEAAIEACRTNNFDMALVDIKLPDTLGTDLIPKMSAIQPDMCFIIMTAHASLETATNAVGLHNVLGYETKPLDLSRLLLLIKEIFARKAAENALRESEELYRTLTDSMLDMVSRIDNKGDYSYLSPSFKNITGFEPDELLGKPPLEFVHPDDIDIAREIFEIDENTTGTLKAEYRHKHANGNYVWIESVGKIMYENDGQVTGAVFGNRDISALKKTDEIIWENRERYRVLYESLSEAIFIVEPKTGQITDANPAADKIYGYKPDELTTKCYKDISAEHENLDEMASGSPVRIPQRKHRRGDGSTFPVEIIAADITLDGYPMRILAIRDITARTRNRDEISRLRKIETLGVIAGGIAHSFNNILTAIRGDIYYAMTLAREDLDEALEALAFAEKACVKAKDLTAQMLSFARHEMPQVRPRDIETILRDTTDFTLRGSNVKSIFSIPPDLLPALVDSSQIAQVIQIITLNAMQAMPDGGTLEIRAKKTSIPENSPLLLKQGDYISVCFRDTGSGIDAENIENIFDPYFTTKGGNPGLGLTIALSIISKHGGHIYAESHGSGAEICILLPASPVPIDTTADTTDYIVPGSGRILVLEDNEMIGNMLLKQLERIGYQPSIATDNDLVVTMFREASEEGIPYDAIILDLTVPGGLGGREAIAEMIKINPDIKAIVASGYFADPVVAEYKKYGFKAFLPKPYNIGELSRALNDVLENQL